MLITLCMAVPKRRRTRRTPLAEEESQEIQLQADQSSSTAHHGTSSIGMSSHNIGPSPDLVLYEIATPPINTTRCPLVRSTDGWRYSQPPHDLNASTSQGFLWTPHPDCTPAGQWEQQETIGTVPGQSWPIAATTHQGTTSTGCGMTGSMTGPDTGTAGNPPKEDDETEAQPSGRIRGGLDKPVTAPKPEQRKTSTKTTSHRTVFIHATHGACRIWNLTTPWLTPPAKPLNIKQSFFLAKWYGNGADRPGSRKTGPQTTDFAVAVLKVSELYAREHRPWCFMFLRNWSLHTSLAQHARQPSRLCKSTVVQLNTCNRVHGGREPRLDTVISTSACFTSPMTVSPSLSGCADTATQHDLGNCKSRQGTRWTLGSWQPTRLGTRLTSESKNKNIALHPLHTPQVHASPSSITPGTEREHALRLRVFGCLHSMDQDTAVTASLILIQASGISASPRMSQGTYRITISAVVLRSPDRYVERRTSGARASFRPTRPPAFCIDSSLLHASDCSVLSKSYTH